MTRPAESGTARLPSDLPALTTAFLLLVGFTFSDDIVEFALDVTGHSRFAATDRQWLVLSLDLLLILGTAMLKRRISETPADLTTFLRWLFTGWWALGAALVIVGHLVLILTAERRAELTDVAAVWISIAASVVFVAAMTMLLLSALAERSASRSWLVPMVLGTFVAQVASALWYPVINVDGGCAGDVSPVFFSQMPDMLGLVLLAVAVELNYVRRTATTRDPGLRVAPVFIVLMLCIALALDFSMLVKADLGPRCGTAAVWHEYIAFVVSTQALAIGLATMVWLLVVSARATDET